MRFHNKAVLVTGASRGIGKVVALQFASEGANVAVHYNRNREAAEHVLKSLPQGAHLLVQADISDAEESKYLIDTVIEKMGALDILVNNAGMFIEHRISECNYETWQDAWKKTISTNLTGQSNLLFLAAKYMMQHDGGRIVNVSSRGAFRGEPDAPAYGAAKAGLNALSQSMAKALAPYNIYITTVAPGWVATDMAQPYLSGKNGDDIRKQSPLGRVARPEELADVVLFLAEEGHEFITGAIVDINGASYLRT